MESIFRAYDKEILAVSSTAVGFDKDILDGPDDAIPNRAQFVVEGGPIRYWLHDSDKKGVPTASEGLPGVVGQLITISGEPDVRNFRAIRESVDATLNTQFSTLQ